MPGCPLVSPPGGGPQPGRAGDWNRTAAYPIVVFVVDRTGNLGAIARQRVAEGLRGERIVLSESVGLRMSPSLVEDWKLFVTRGKDAGYGYMVAGRVLIDFEARLDGVDPLAGLVWFKERGTPRITHAWVDPSVQRKGVGRLHITAYKSFVSPKVVMVGPFSEAGREFARSIGARIGR